MYTHVKVSLKQLSIPCFITATGLWQKKITFHAHIWRRYSLKILVYHFHLNYCTVNYVIILVALTQVFLEFHSF